MRLALVLLMLAACGAAEPAPMPDCAEVASVWCTVQFECGRPFWSEADCLAGREQACMREPSSPSASDACIAELAAGAPGTCEQFTSDTPPPEACR